MTTQQARPTPRSVRARSIGSLPLHPGLRLTPSIPVPTHLAAEGDDLSAMMSPSRLPATECMSYFPPFETMGSGPSSPAETPEAGPSRLRDNEVERGHSKGRSLGSLAGLMSLLSPVTTPLRPASANSTPIHPPNYRSTSDGDVLQALAKRVNHGKRRVLEPMTLANEQLTEDGDLQYRRRRTGDDAEKMKRKASTDGSEDLAEGLATPSRARRRPRPLLTVPIPSLPAWRFPIPSPPVTCLSPDIPLSAFSPIENPASNPSSTESSPSKPLTPSSLSHEQLIDDEEEVEGNLSPTTSCYASFSSGSSRPATPDDDSDEQWTMSSSPRSFNINDTSRLYPRLERTVSQVSCDSKETIKPGKGMLDWDAEMDGEVTPKAGRSWRAG